MSAHRDLLTQLDAAIGDADHGINMERGFTAAAAAMETANGATPGEILLETASTLMFRVGGAAGPLYGSGFREAGNSLGKAASFGPQDLVDALRAALAGIQAVGAAVEGDKTMVDAWAPAVEALGREISAGDDIVEALGRAREAAEAGAQATVPLQARKGRASYLGPRSVGHRDPGASSTSLLFAALERALREA
ncbi:MAG: dihydroxyacetone kinase subunit L [Actinobacteria bacterium]|nr:dihydroxyacetone kinase subunit L [Actinomycetota bacterium]